MRFRGWLPGEQCQELTPQLWAFSAFEMQAANPCSKLCRKVLTHVSEPSDPNPSCFTILWKFVKFYCLSIDDFATITVAKWDTAISYSSGNCFLCRHIGNCTYPSLAFELRVPRFLCDSNILGKGY